MVAQSSRSGEKVLDLLGVVPSGLAGGLQVVRRRKE